MQVAYTLEQCWHPVPGGSAIAALRVAAALTERGNVELVGVAGRHRRPPAPSFRPNVPMRWLPVGRPLLYDAWNRCNWPKVESVTGVVDVCHSTVAVPAATSLPSVVTVHDVAFLHTPERFTSRGVKVMTAGLERVRDADVVCCPSEQTRSDLLEIGFDSDQIMVVPWGVDATPAANTDIEGVRSEFDLPDRFVLFVGTIEPRKNLPRLVEAMAGIDLPLVVAGADGWGDRLGDGSGGADIRFLGFVPSDRLAALYASSTVFAYPSLEEGFGMPVLEAMAQGVPVVTSSGTATEEAAGGAAVLVEPRDVGSITSGIDEALARADQLATLGRARATSATWEKSAALTENAYELAVERAEVRR